MFQEFDLYYYNGLLLTNEKMLELGIDIASYDDLNLLLSQASTVTFYSNGQSISMDSKTFIDWNPTKQSEYYYFIEASQLILIAFKKCYGIGMDGHPIVFYNDPDLRDERLDYVNYYGIQPVTNEMNHLNPENIPPVEFEMGRSNPLVQSYLHQKDQDIYKNLSKSYFLVRR